MSWLFYILQLNSTYETHHKCIWILPDLAGSEKKNQGSNLCKLLVLALNFHTKVHSTILLDVIIDLSLGNNCYMMIESSRWQILRVSLEWTDYSSAVKYANLNAKTGTCYCSVLNYYALRNSSFAQLCCSLHCYWLD